MDMLLVQLGRIVGFAVDNGIAIAAFILSVIVFQKQNREGHMALQLQLAKDCVDATARLTNMRVELSEILYEIKKQKFTNPQAKKDHEEIIEIMEMNLKECDDALGVCKEIRRAAQSKECTRKYILEKSAVVYAKSQIPAASKTALETLRKSTDE